MSLVPEDLDLARNAARHYADPCASLQADDPRTNGFVGAPTAYFPGSTQASALNRAKRG